jgi:hypothetical protein
MEKNWIFIVGVLLVIGSLIGVIESHSVGSSLILAAIGVVLIIEGINKNKNQ